METEKEKEEKDQKQAELVDDLLQRNEKASWAKDWNMNVSELAKHEMGGGFANAVEGGRAPVREGRYQCGGDI